MSGAIERVIKAFETFDSDPFQRRAITAAARAELAAKDATIERLRKALEHAASYMVTLCMDRPVHEDGEVVGHWQTVDWLIGLRELAEESHSIALSSLPPSDMRLVPLERLREALEEIDRVWEEDLTGEIPYIVTNALSSLPPSDVRLVPVERLREIAELVAGLGYAPDWLAAAIREAEREKG